MKTIYYGDIITMEPLKAEAILVENEIIKPKDDKITALSTPGTIEDPATATPNNTD